MNQVLNRKKILTTGDYMSDLVMAVALTLKLDAYLGKIPLNFMENAP